MKRSGGIDTPRYASTPVDCVWESWGQRAAVETSPPIHPACFSLTNRVAKASGP